MPRSCAWSRLSRTPSDLVRSPGRMITGPHVSATCRARPRPTGGGGRSASAAAGTRGCPEAGPARRPVQPGPRPRASGRRWTDAARPCARSRTASPRSQSLLIPATTSSSTSSSRPLSASNGAVTPARAPCEPWNPCSASSRSAPPASSPDVGDRARRCSTPDNAPAPGDAPHTRSRPCHPRTCRAWRTCHSQRHPRQRRGPRSTSPATRREGPGPTARTHARRSARPCAAARASRPVPPHRGMPVMLDMGQPVGDLDQRRPCPRTA